MQLRPISFSRYLLIAVVAVMSASASAQLAFHQGAFAMDWDENPAIQSSNLANLNAQIRDALNSDSQDFCFSVNPTPADILKAPDLNCSIGNAAEPNGYTAQKADFALELGPSDFDYDTRLAHKLTITAYTLDSTPSDRTANSLTVSFTVMDFDEPPTLVRYADFYDADGNEVDSSRHWEMGDSETINLFAQYRDPEGLAVQYTQIVVCDTGNPGSFGNCSPTDSRRDENILTLTQQGPNLSIRINQQNLTQAGVYWAKLYFAAMDSNGNVSENAAHFEFFIKNGVNNAPNFTAIGYESEVEEVVAKSNQVRHIDPSPQGAWDANDLDQDPNGSHMDQITYSLVGASPMCRGMIPNAVQIGQMCIELAYRGGVALNGYFIDYESNALSAMKTMTVTVQASDGWDTDEVPIEISVNNINELYAHTDLSDGPVIPMRVRLIEGEARNFDLNSYFTDPEGDAIEFNAYANRPELVTLNGDRLTIHGAGTSADHPSIQDTVTIEVSDPMDDNVRVGPLQIQVFVRNTNSPPRFENPSVLTRGGSITENQPAGTAASGLIGYVDDDSEPEELRVETSSPLFSGVIEPLWENDQICKVESTTCLRQVGKFVLVSTGPLNHEQQAKHDVKFGLHDGWVRTDPAKDPTAMINVLNANDPPMSVGQIPNQEVNVGGSVQVSFSQYFTDEDVDDRIIVTARSADTSIAAVKAGTAVDVEVTGVGQGATQITVIATDNSGATATQQFDVMVQPNRPPVAVEEAFTEALPKNRELVEGIGFEFSTNGLFTDPDGDSINVTVSSLNVQVLLATTVETTVILTPRELGEAELQFVATDAAGMTTTRMETIKVVEELTPQNEKPLFQPDQLTKVLPDIRSLAVGDTYMLNLQPLFTDPEGEELRFEVSSSDVSVLEAILSSDGDQVLLEAVAVGTANLSITATDEAGNTTSMPSPVEIQVVSGEPTDGNQAPVFDEDAIANALPFENSIVRQRYFKMDLTGVVSDPDGDEITLSAKSSDETVLRAIHSKASNTLFLIARVVGKSDLTLTAKDSNGATDEFKTNISVVRGDSAGANSPPEVDQEALTEALPVNNTIAVPEFFELELLKLFSDPDAGDRVVTVTAASSNSDVLFVTTDDKHLMTALGVTAGTATLTLTAADSFDAETSTPIEITVTAPTANSIAFRNQTLDRNGPVVLDIREALGSSIKPDTRLAIRSVVDNANVIEAFSDGSKLTINALNEGSASVKLIVESDEGVISRTMFNVDVVNAPPLLVSSIPNQQADRVDAIELDLSNTFRDADGESLTFSVSTTDDSVAKVELQGKSLVIEGLEVGESAIVLAATDESGNRTETTFSVQVHNIAPIATGSLGTIQLEVGSEPSSVSIQGLFEDDGDILTYSIESSESGIVETRLSQYSVEFTPVSRGDAYVTLTATDTHGGSVSVEGKVTVSDDQLRNMAEKSLAGFGRSLLSSVSLAVAERATSESHQGDLSRGSSRFDREQSYEQATGLAPETYTDYQENIDPLSLLQSRDNAIGSVRSPLNTNLLQLLGNGFTLNVGSESQRKNWTIWSRSDRQHFNGIDYNGDVTNAYLGIDAKPNQKWLIGASLGNHRGNANYSFGTASQQMELALMQLLPYVRYSPSDATSVWGAIGLGTGDLTTTVTGASDSSSRLQSNLALLSGRQLLASTGKFEIAIRGDAASTTLQSEVGTAASDSLATTVNRASAGFEGAYFIELSNVTKLTPFGQMNFRSDGGDGENSSGLEATAGLRVSHHGLSIEVVGQSFEARGIDAYSQSGVSATATFKPNQLGNGFFATISPRWGAPIHGVGQLMQSGVEPMRLQTDSRAHSNPENMPQEMSIDSRLGYGLFVSQDRFLLTPFVSVNQGEFDSRQIQIGARLTQLATSRAQLNVGFSFGQQSLGDSQRNESVSWTARLRF